VRFEYPDSPRGDVEDDYHGHRVHDPYRWMEALDAPELRTWIDAQHRVTSKYLESLPLVEGFRARITQLWNYPKTSLPIVENGRLFYQRNEGLQKQAVVYMRDGPDAAPSVVLDPNELSPDGSIALMAIAPSPDARFLAYTLSEGGADWQAIHVRDLGRGEDLVDSVLWMRFSALAWTRDNRGFFYSRFPEPPARKTYEAALSGHALYYHRLGTSQTEDLLIFARPDLPAWFVHGTVSEDGRYLLIALFEGATNSNRLYVADLGDPASPEVAAPIRPIVETDGAEYAPIGVERGMLFVRSDAAAPNRCVLARDLAVPADEWRVVIPERRHRLGAVALAGGRLVAESLVDVQSRLEIFDPWTGDRLGTLPLPAPGVVTALDGRSAEREVWLTFTSPLQPATVYRADLAACRLTPFEPASAPVDLSRYETRQLFAASRDGTRVPFFVTGRAGLPRDGTTPAMIYGYGGFSVDILPAYRPDVPAWLERGGLWITVNARGGSEYGEAWHRAGMREQKQNVFDDFIAVAEYLIAERYTGPSHLAMLGGSNGGLLVAAVMEQRPDLFAAALPVVGVLDMLRYDRFTGGGAWVTEYGSASDATLFGFLRAYSPLHNLVDGQCYPATLVCTADYDDRVVPSHSFKFVAALQRAQGCDRPVLIRIETQGSHGYRPTDKRIAELADQWAFAAEHTRMPVEKG
jgi:prolyl oligopeptidase